MVHTAINEEECYSRLKAGDEAVFRRLIDIYGPVLCHYSNKIIFDSAAAEDIITEVFVKVWHKRETFDSLTHMKKFFYTATRNASLQFLRNRERDRRKFEVFSEVNADPPVDEVIHAELMADLRQIINGLPEKMREVFILGYVHQLSNREIALQLNLSDQTVRNQKTKALAIIRSKIGERAHLLVWLPLAALFE